ncbi:iron-containing alcohol dehydrogenase [Paenibacillus aurantius]|uniref:Iron-containing alcohol dehydrogenase n=1 Tax=Paenibacillus aurantius TaxID=2918900 RepID=A0AA96LD77_9BACL|nr:iron-containing alcohol dehydrogenase [Paenibacillus aurantius]WNQ09572.1 iron-containing alcohol dehydrogenase [Paenibacillus aurantius]
MGTHSKLTFAPLCYIGCGAVCRLSDEVNKHGAKRVLLIADPILVKLGTASRIAAQVEGPACSVDVFADVTPEPSLELGERLIEHTRSGKYDFVVGLGGGSALDLAKLAAVLSGNVGKAADYLNLSASRRIAHKGLPKVLIPTTSGTGSEVTNIAVLSLDHTKDVVVHDYLLADAAIVDPELTLTVPPRVTAATGMDALTHAVEAYLSVSATPATDALALHAVRLIGRSLRRAVQDGAYLPAREEMSQASFMAGLAFFNAGVAGVHALAYPLGGQFHLPHGEANAVLLPYVMRHIASSCRGRMTDLRHALDPGSVFQPDAEAPEPFVAQLHNLIKDIGLPERLEAWNIAERDLAGLADDACKQTRLLARSPMPLGRDDIYAIYKAACDGPAKE